MTGQSSPEYHPEQFELKPWLTPAQMDHGVTCGVTDSYLSLIIILYYYIILYKISTQGGGNTSLIYIIYNVCTGMFPLGACATLCLPLYVMTRLPSKYSS